MKRICALGLILVACGPSGEEPLTPPTEVPSIEPVQAEPEAEPAEAAVEEAAVEEATVEEATEAAADPHPPTDPTNPPPEIERPYDEGVDAQAQIDAAIATPGKRVMLMFGANWCPWCRRLEYTFRNDETIAARLGESFTLVHVDIGERESDTNRDIAQRYGDPLSHGLPCLVMLDEAGAVAHVQETGSLENGDRHDPAKVLEFLQAWMPPS